MLVTFFQCKLESAKITILNYATWSKKPNYSYIKRSFIDLLFAQYYKGERKKEDQLTEMCSVSVCERETRNAYSIFVGLRLQIEQIAAKIRIKLRWFIEKHCSQVEKCSISVFCDGVNGISGS
jgi:hypothetical protein